MLGTVLAWLYASARRACPSTQATASNRANPDTLDRDVPAAIMAALRADEGAGAPRSPGVGCSTPGTGPSPRTRWPAAAGPGRGRPGTGRRPGMTVSCSDARTAVRSERPRSKPRSNPLGRAPSACRLLGGLGQNLALSPP